MNQIVLAFDLAKVSGYSAYDGESYATGIVKFESLKQFRQKLTEIVAYWTPCLCVCAKPFSFSRAGLFTLAHYSSILELVCEELGVQYALLQGEHSEAHIRKVIFGTGKVSKQDAMDRYNQKDDNCADSCVIAEYSWKYILHGEKN